MRLAFFAKPFAAIAVVATLLASCTSNSAVDENYVNYINSEQYQKDLDNLFYYGALKQCVTALMINAGTNNFTAQKGDSLNMGDRRLAYWGTFHDIMGTLQENEKEFKESIRRLNAMRVFDVATPQLDANGNVVAMGPRHTSPLQCTDPESRAMALLATPAQAAPPLLFAQAFYEFFSMPSELAKESRKTIITVANKLTDEDRQVIFNNLDKTNKMAQTDYKEWWNDFSDGKYDVKAHRVLKDILAQQDSRAKTNYMSVADDMDILNEKQFMSAAGRVVTAGAKLNVEVINKVLGNTIKPAEVKVGDKAFEVSYSDIVDKMDQINNSAELIKSTVEGKITMEQATDYAVGTVLKAYVSDKTKDVVCILPGGYEIEMDHGMYGGGEWVEYGQNFYAGAVKDINKWTGKDKSTLVWGDDDERLSQIKLTDKDGKPTNMIVARDKNTGALFAVKLNDYDETTSTIVLPGGEYDVTAIGDDGNKQTITSVGVEDGETSSIDVSKKEREIFQKLLELHADDSDSDFMAWLNKFKETRAQKQAERDDSTNEEPIDKEPITEEPADDVDDIKGFALIGKWKAVSVDYVDPETLKEIEDKNLLLNSTLSVNGSRFVLNYAGEVATGACKVGSDATSISLTSSDFTGTHETFICPIEKLAIDKMRFTVSFHLKDYDEDDLIVVDERDVRITLTMVKTQ